MKVNLENFVFCYWGLKGLRTPPPSSPQLVRPVILLLQSDIFTVKFRTPWTAPNNFQQHVLEPMITIPMN